MSEEIFNLWRSRKTVLEMLNDRKYDVKSLEMNYEEFKKYSEKFEDDKDLREDMYIQISRKDLHTLHVVWNAELDLSTSTVKKLFDKLRKKPDEQVNCILVIRGKITPHASGVIANLRLQKFFIEIFTELELQYNISKHELVPQHIICSAKKKTQVLEWYGIERIQLPRIKAEEPMCRYLGAQKGQLIKIVRPSETMDPKKVDIYYRIVV